MGEEFTGGVVTTPAAEAPRKLFLWFEASGINITDWRGVPDNIASLFDVVAIVIPNLMNDNAGISTPSLELDLFTSVEALLPPGIQSERWIDLFFGDGMAPQLAQCQHGSSDPPACTPGVMAYMSTYQSWPGWGARGAPVGIAFDDEVGE